MLDALLIITISPNQQGVERLASEVVWIFTDMPVILVISRLFSLQGGTVLRRYPTGSISLRNPWDYHRLLARGLGKMTALMAVMRNTNLRSNEEF